MSDTGEPGLTVGEYEATVRPKPEPLTASEIEALRLCVANATRGDPIGFTERDRCDVGRLAADAIGKLRAVPPADVRHARDHEDMTAGLPPGCIEIPDPEINNSRVYNVTTVDGCLAAIQHLTRLVLRCSRPIKQEEK